MLAVSPRSKFMIKRSIFFAFVVSVLAVASGSGQNGKPAVLKFADLKKWNSANETFQIEGYVIDIYNCPPCGPGMMCKPCIPNNITLVETADWRDLSSIQRLRVFTDHTERFETKKKYLVTVKVKGTPKSGSLLDSVDLVSIDRVPTRSANSTLFGEWTGESICTVKNSPCHDEKVVYTIGEPDNAGNLKMQADKIVNGQGEDMGTLDCNFKVASSTVSCLMKNGLWEFKVTAGSMIGTLKLTDGTLFRNFSVKKSVKPGQ